MKRTSHEINREIKNLSTDKFSTILEKVFFGIVVQRNYSILETFTLVYGSSEIYEGNTIAGILILGTGVVIAVFCEGLCERYIDKHYMYSKFIESYLPEDEQKEVKVITLKQINRLSLTAYKTPGIKLFYALTTQRTFTLLGAAGMFWAFLSNSLIQAVFIVLGASILEALGTVFIRKELERKDKEQAAKEAEEQKELDKLKASEWKKKEF